MPTRWFVGTDEEDKAAIDGLPDGWVNTLPFLTPYSFGLHTGADLNKNTPTHNLDKGAPIYASDHGFVASSGLGRGNTWGWIVVVDYGDFVVRYAHLNHINYPVIKAGAEVHPGDIIGHIGNADGYYGPGDHLHVDVTTDDLLIADPSDWPGTDRARLLASYVDPIAFIIDRKRKDQGPPMPYETAPAIALERLIIRASASKSSADLGRVEQWALIYVKNGSQLNGYIELNDGRGWVAIAYLNMQLTLRTMVVTGASNINRRVGPGTSYKSLGYLTEGTLTPVWAGSEVNGFVKRAALPDWLASAYLKPIDAPPPPSVTNIIDISHLNTLTSTTIPAGAFAAIFHKATQGTPSSYPIHNTDPEYANRREIFAGAALWGATHFGTGDDAILQARHFVYTAKPDGKTLLVLDFENNPYGSSMTVDQAEDFVEEVRRLTGKRPLIYTRANMIPGATDLNMCDLWVSSQDDPPKLPPAFDRWVINQNRQARSALFTDVIDYNRFMGTPEQLAAYWQAAAPASVDVFPPVTPRRVYVVATDGLYIRPLPARAGGVAVPFGTPLDVTTSQIVDGIIWLRVVGPGLQGFAALRPINGSEIYLDTTPPVFAPPTLSSFSLLGEHSYGNGGWGVVEDAATLAENKTPMAGAVILRQGWDGETTPSHIKNVSRSTIVIERWAPEAHDASNLLEQAGYRLDWRKDDLSLEGEKAVELYLAAFPIDRNADYHQIINEPVVVNARGTASFWIRAMKRAEAAEAAGIKLAVLCTPFYWPALPGETRTDLADTNFWLAAETIEMIRAIIRGGHILVAHEYINPEPTGSWVGEPMGRLARGIALLPTDCRAVPVILAEYGTYSGALMSTEDYIRHVSDGEAFERAGKMNLKALILWVVGPYKNQENQTPSDITKHRAAIAEYIKTRRF